MNNDLRSEVEKGISGKGKSVDFSLTVMYVKGSPGMPECEEIGVIEILRSGEYNK